MPIIKKYSRDTQKTYQIVLMRHGQSIWNVKNQFTGWADVPLTEVGINEAALAGKRLKKLGFNFDKGYCSVLSRSLHTLQTALEETNEEEVPIKQSWRLNEMCMGALTGKNKQRVREEYGNEQVHMWRRGAIMPPPAMDTDHKYHPLNDERYKHLPPDSLPDTEVSLTLKLEPFGLQEKGVVYFEWENFQRYL